MMFHLLDVAVGPIYVIAGFFIVLIVAIIAAIVFFAVKVLKNTKKDVEK